MDAERAKDPANVIANGFHAQVQLAGDLLRRASVLQKTQYLRLSRGQVWMGWRLRFEVDVRELPEDADDTMAFVEADGADFDRDAFAGLVDQDYRTVDVLVADHVLRKCFPGAPGLLGRDDGRHLAAADVSDQPSGSRIDPPDDLVFVDDVAWDAHPLEGVGNITADRFQARHGLHSCVNRPGAHRPFWAIFESPSALRCLRYVDAQLACGALRQSASPAWMTYSRPSTS